jgi:hypothetical protein
MSNISRIRTRSFVFSFAVGPLIISTTLSGCGSSAPEPVQPISSSASTATAPAIDSDEVPIKQNDVARPKDYSDALKRIEGYRDTIRNEIAAGRPTKAHRSLDELDIVLKWLPAIARDSGVPKVLWEKVNTTAKAIQNAFDQIHSRIDDGKAPDYASVSDSIDSSIAELKKISGVPKTSETEKKP